MRITEREKQVIEFAIGKAAIEFRRAIGTNDRTQNWRQFLDLQELLDGAEVLDE